MRKRMLWVGVVLLAALALAACASDQATECPELECPTVPGIIETIMTAWEGSGHADAEAEAFVHWDEDDPAVVPARCAKCHSEGGHLDFLGEDGTAFGTVDSDHPIGTVITCDVCHNATSLPMDSVVMPSGIELSDLGTEARCMQCHQGNESTVSVNAAIEEAGVEEDTVSEDLGFKNIHYYAAAASKYGTLAQGGYEYDGKSYDGNFAHVDAFDTCVECHSPHTLEVQVDDCATCHADVSSVEDLRNVRMAGSFVDFDGDGDLEEGIAGEIAGLQEKLYTAIQAYASEVAGSAIAYDSHAYPYFFNDTDGDGALSEEEAVYPNGYANWTPRLVKATYNYQVSQKDPGAYAHGGKYIIQLLWDSTEDLNTAISTPVDLEGAHRIDHGHFAGSEEAFRHWDEDGYVEAECSRCHAPGGLPRLLSGAEAIVQPIANGLTCDTCHDDMSTWTRYEVASVTFPSGAEIDSGDANTNLCMSCHQGLQSTTSLNELLAASHPLSAENVADLTQIAGPDEIGSDLASASANPHYFAAGATLFGTEAKGGYEYEGKTYAGRNEHVPAYSTCTSCHSAHELEVQIEQCAVCHPGAETEEDLLDIRMDTEEAVDYDGDGDLTEGIAGEIETLRVALLASIQQYATANELDAIIYNGDSYPYWFIDSDANGEVDPGEAIYPNQYKKWTPRMLRAAYNYSFSIKDPGAFAHNADYILQLLFDSIEDLGGSTANFKRP